MDETSLFTKLAWCKPDWCYPSMSKQTNELLQQCIDVSSISIPDDIKDIIKRSKEFPVPFPIESVRIHTLKDLVPVDVLKRNIASTYPLVHERVLLLMTHFLVYKREFGSSIEKAFYKDMTVPEFVDRILKMRAITFMGPRDTYRLITGEQGQDGWELVGTLQQKPPLTLDKCLSYDEMKIASMVYVSGRTTFINNGTRDNVGKPQTDGVEREGVIIGLIGARLKRKFRMEYEDLYITEEQNSLENGYGEEITPTTCLNVLKTTVNNNQSAKHMWRQMWAEFYQVPSYTYQDVKPKVDMKRKMDDTQKYTDRYIRLGSTKHIFDNEIYYKRLIIPFECALLEANERAKEDGKMAFLYIVGIGLGVWKGSAHQVDIFVLTLIDRINSLMENSLLNHVSDVDLAHVMGNDSIMEYFSKIDAEGAASSDKRLFLKSEKHPNGGIHMYVDHREPSTALLGEHLGKLLVVTYPWDGNAHPGNEFWIGRLKSSGDPAAACSSQIAELHNAHINTSVTGSNVRVASSKGFVCTISDHCRDFCCN